MFVVILYIRELAKHETLLFIAAWSHTRIPQQTLLTGLQQGDYGVPWLLFKSFLRLVEKSSGEIQKVCNIEDQYIQQSKNPAAQSCWSSSNIKIALRGNGRRWLANLLDNVYRFWDLLVPYLLVTVSFERLNSWTWTIKSTAPYSVSTLFESSWINTVEFSSSPR